MNAKVKQKKLAASVWLLKNGISNAEEVLSHPDRFNSLPIVVPNCNQAALYYKSTYAKSPKWVSLFQGQGSQLSLIKTSGAAAVFVIQINDELSYAITFGYGWTALKNDCYERQFGLKTVLNVVDHEKMRCIDVQSLEGVPLQQRTQAGKMSDVADFGLDVEQDILCAATGQPQDENLGSTLSGKDSLKVSIPLGHLYKS